MKSRKFKFLRPLAEKVTKENARHWWQYAFKCISKSNKSRKGSIKEFKIPQSQLKLFQEEFSTKFCAFFKNKDNQKKWTKEAMILWRHMLLSLDEVTL